MNETPAAVTATEVQPIADGTASATPAPNPLLQFLPFILIFAILYFMMIRPQQRKEKERRKMIDELRVGSKVVFGNGILGDAAAATERTFLVETAGSKMGILRSWVQDVVPAASAAK